MGDPKIDLKYINHYCLRISRIKLANFVSSAISLYLLKIQFDPFNPLTTTGGFIGSKRLLNFKPNL